MTYPFIYRDIAEALYQSLKQDPFYVALERSVSNDPAICSEAMHSYFDYSMLEGKKYGELWLPEGQNYGASVWTKPVDQTLAKLIASEKKNFLRQYLGEASLRSYREITEYMSSKIREIVPCGSWYLSIVGIAPQFQGQGLGSSLIKPVLSKLDGLGIPSYLETFTSRNKRFYERLGYQDVSAFMEPVTGCEYWVMIREPN